MLATIRLSIILVIVLGFADSVKATVYDWSFGGFAFCC